MYLSHPRVRAPSELRMGLYKYTAKNEIGNPRSRRRDPGKHQTANRMRENLQRGTCGRRCNRGTPDLDSERNRKIAEFGERRRAHRQAREQMDMVDQNSAMGPWGNTPKLRRIGGWWWWGGSSYRMVKYLHVAPLLSRFGDISGPGHAVAQMRFPTFYS